MEQIKKPFEQLDGEEKSLLKEEYLQKAVDVCIMCRCHREPDLILGKFTGDRMSPPDYHQKCTCCGEDYTPDRPTVKEFYDKQC